MVIINIIDEEKEHLKRENKQLKHELLKVRDENEFLQRAFRMAIGQEPKKNHDEAIISDIDGR